DSPRDRFIRQRALTLAGFKNHRQCGHVCGYSVFRRQIAFACRWARSWRPANRYAADAAALNLCHSGTRSARWSSFMIWHIFKKDLRITWPLAVLVGALHWVVPLLALFGGFVPGGLRALNVLRLLVVTGPLASGFLITAAVHLDVIPGVRQDWLVR